MQVLAPGGGDFEDTESPYDGIEVYQAFSGEIRKYSMKVINILIWWLLKWYGINSWKWIDSRPMWLSEMIKMIGTVNKKNDSMKKLLNDDKEIASTMDRLNHYPLGNGIKGSNSTSMVGSSSPSTYFFIYFFSSGICLSATFILGCSLLEETAKSILSNSCFYGR